MDLKKLFNILAKELNVPESKINENSDLIQDLGADSLSIMQVVMVLEDEYHITVDEDELRKLRTVKDFMNYISSKKISN